jgi:squalene-hopene/tetraprenyl-beta-curcumene cyclase
MESTLPGSRVTRQQQHLDEAIERASQWLLAQQRDDGHWCAELEGDSILESEYILLLAYLGQDRSDDALAAARCLVDQQLPTGGWAMYPGGELEVSGSVKAYFALKLTGHDPQSESMQRAKAAIRAAGGADAINSFTRFYLALLGQISYDHCPAVPAELILLPDWSPINIYRMSAWSRTIVVPLSIMWAHRPVRQVEPERGISELFLRPPHEWPELRCPGLDRQSGWLTWENFFQTADRTLKGLERRGIKPLRAQALRQATQWMLKRCQDSDGLGAIFPPIIWSVVALKCLGYADNSPEQRANFAELEKLKVRQGDRLWLQPCLSPVWDTVITLRALAAAGFTTKDEPIARGIGWLLANEIRTPGDWSRRVSCDPGGWAFEYRNRFYPDIDDTIMALMALRETRSTGFQAVRASDPHTGKADATTGAGRRAIAWTLAMQNRDGGWGAFDRDNDAEFLCRVPFADHNAMIDPSTPDIAGRVLEALAAWDIKRGHPAVERAIAYLRSTQEADGAWFGRWGVNYIYGTWQVLVGLTAAGIETDDPAVERAAQWLLDHQQTCGGWGESVDTYAQPELRGQGNPTPSQTAWALLGLLAAGHAASTAVRRGVQYLLDTQLADGTWEETEFTGTGFPRVFYLRYHYYRVYFPLLALAKFRSPNEALVGVTGCGSTHS